MGVCITHFQLIQCKKIIVNLLKDKYLVFGLEGDKSLYFRGFHYIVTMIKLPPNHHLSSSYRDNRLHPNDL